MKPQEFNEWTQTLKPDFVELTDMPERVDVRASI